MFLIIKKVNLYIVLGCFALIAVILIFVAANFKTANSLDVPTVDIVLDAGHGSSDAGASGKNGSIEKEINLAITLKLRDKLIAEGITVGLTRENDNSLADSKKKDMHYRRDFAIASNPKLFVSIHQNTFPESQYRGAQVWYSKNNAESKNFAQNMQSALIETNPTTKREAKKAESNIFLLKHLTMPAIIIECGFLTNYQEEQLLMQDTYQDKLAEIIKKGIADELERLETIPTPSPITSTTPSLT